MTVEAVAANDEVVSVRLVRGKPVADIDALRKYHRELYHTNKQEELEVCPAMCKRRAGDASDWAGSKYILDSGINDTILF